MNIKVIVQVACMSAFRPAILCLNGSFASTDLLRKRGVMSGDTLCNVIGV